MILNLSHTCNKKYCILRLIYFFIKKITYFNVLVRKSTVLHMLEEGSYLWKNPLSFPQIKKSIISM